MIKKLTQVEVDSSLNCTIALTEHSGEHSGEHSAPLDSDQPKMEFSARWIESADELETLAENWKRLMQTAVHQNLMFDPDFLIPAFRHLGSESVRVLVIEAPRKKKSKSDATHILCGLFPLVSTHVYGMPISAMQTWVHDQSLDGTPLIRMNCVREVLEFTLDFLRSDSGVGLLELGTVSNEGSFGRALTDVLRDRNCPVFYRDSWTRACFKPESDAVTYQQKHVSKGVIKTQRRLVRRLNEQGTATIISHRDPDLADTLIDQFLELESSGWKADSGTSLNCNASTEKFFREMVTRSLKNEKLSFLSLQLDGKPISMLCDLYSATRGYAFKTAYDDAMSQFSPGQMIELRNIDFLHDEGIEFVDSCTDPDNQTMNRLWGGRTRFQNLVVPLGGCGTRTIVATMPILQHLSRAWRR